jgi:putative hemolysin
VKLIRSPLYLALALLTQCSSCKDHDPSPEQQLPPATQTGANTFGCLVNGKAWTPRGNDGTANLAASYCCVADGGVLDVRTYRIVTAENVRQTIILDTRQISSTGMYELTDINRSRATWIDRNTGCYLSNQDAGTYCRGQLRVTRLDVQTGIVAGTFDFTLAKPGCDTIKVTQGRFDYHL